MPYRTSAPSNILRRSQVEARTGLSRSAIYGKMNPRDAMHDPSFPRAINLGGRAVGWIESEIDEWIAGRIAASRTR